MHPEVHSQTPGTCPICGMALVAPTTSKPPAHTSPASSYTPLIVIFVMITLVAAMTAGSSLTRFLMHFMIGFFLVFGSFKLMDLPGFVQGYATYDLLAMRWKEYGYVYPFLELGFGLVMLTGYHPGWLLWTEFAVMMFSGLGVARKLMHHEKFTCACLGTFLKVPLTNVTVVEDFGMAALILAYMLFT